MSSQWRGSPVGKELCKHQDLSSHPRSLVKPRMVVWICDLGAPEVGEPLKLLSGLAWSL